MTLLKEVHERFLKLLNYSIEYSIQMNRSYEISEINDEEIDVTT